MKLRLLSLLMIGFACLRAQESEKWPFEWDGYARLLGNYSQINQDAFGPLGALLPKNTSDYQIHQRLNIRYQAQEAWYFEMGLRNRLFWGYQVRELPQSLDDLDADMGAVDMSWTVWNDGNTALVSVIDRLYGRYTDEHWEIRLGRQRINWGRNTVWNPNDIFNQYNYLDFDYDERRGTDAVMAQYFFSGFKSLELAYAPGRADDAGVAAARWLFPVGMYDMQLIGGLYHNDWVLGGGWAGSIKGVGFKGEVSFYTPRNDLGSENLLFSPSIDYNFPNQLYAQVGYLYNQEGTDRTEALLGVSGGQVLEAKNLFPFRSSYFAQLSYPLHPLVTADASAIWTDGLQAAIWIPSIRYNWKQNIDWLILAQIFTGQSFDEEFSMLSTSVFARISYSF